jgi:UDP-N-acetylmuramyl pentapeptide phosphotransferase/UDP-N-acetylglucosamine-1-phosphate transferase
METQILGFFTSFFVVLIATPVLIKVAKLKHLVDEPTEDRKLHKRSIPTIGGIIIFSAFLFSYSLWFPDYGDDLSQSINEYKYLVASLVILFFIGVKDDIIGTSPIVKLSAHFMVAIILVLMADIRITSFHGLFDPQYIIPEWGTIVFSFFIYIVVVNSFNLIDGIDGLASGIGIIACLFFGIWFYFAQNTSLALLGFTLAGSLSSFLIFNLSPAKIFMGDSGSMTIGAIICVLAIKMIEHPINTLPVEIAQIPKPVLAMAILVYPLTDTLRIFIVRAYRGQSPFHADKNHLHHRLVKLGFSHTKTVLILYLATILVVFSTYVFSFFSPNICFALTFIFALSLVALAFLFKPAAK